MKQNLIAQKARISPQFLSFILSGKRTPSWPVAKRLARVTGTDRDIWMDRDMSAISYYMDRLDRLSIIAKMAGIDDERLIEILARTSAWTDTEAWALAQATLTDKNLWTKNDPHTVMHTLEELRHENYPSAKKTTRLAVAR